MEGKLIQAANGKWYREMPKADGSFDYLPVADVDTHQQQITEDSHLKFFNERDHRQKLKRADALTRQLQQLAPPVDPGAGPKIRMIKDEEFFNLTKMYQTAMAKGEQNQCPFQPLASYAHKILKARPVFKGEVGVYGMEILTLEAGYGTGQLVQVPSDVSPTGFVQERPELMKEYQGEFVDVEEEPDE